MDSVAFENHSKHWRHWTSSSIIYLIAVAVLKTGSSGLVAYRLMGKDGNWLWLQTSTKVVYRNSKADYMMFFHRNLT